jgi:hypothetical protein
MGIYTQTCASKVLTSMRVQFLEASWPSIPYFPSSLPTALLQNFTSSLISQSGELREEVDLGSKQGCSFCMWGNYGMFYTDGNNTTKKN